MIFISSNRSLFKIGLVIFSIMIGLGGTAQTIKNGEDNKRIVISLNDNWQFAYGRGRQTIKPGDSLEWSTVSVPHCWNVKDVLDDKPGYYRGIGWYKKKLYLNPSFRNKEIFICFEGVNQQAEVFINGKKAGTHDGGYTGFCIPLKGLLSFDHKGGGADEIEVKADNCFNENIPPLSADFTFFGGIYRNVYLIAVDKIHFDLENNGSNGVFITTPHVSAKEADIAVKGSITNVFPEKKEVTVVTVIKDRSGKTVLENRSDLMLGGTQTVVFNQKLRLESQLHLWSPDDPYLYTLNTRLYDKQTGLQTDEVINPLGIRWFKFDAARGFFINGKPCKLIGTSRHQDYKNMGNAVPEVLQIRDIQLLKNMGGNFLRVAHYPQDPVVLETCDKLGILASVEIPLVNGITESESFTEHCKKMQVEMIRQNFNHPSVIIWGYMNEVLLKPQFAEDKVRQQLYFKNITRLAEQLDSLTRAEDSSRYTMIANHADFDHYRELGLTRIPMLVGWNLYQGWYGGNISGFGEFLDKHRKEIPDKPMLLTEYGADADYRLRSFHPVRFDKSVEYAGYYHKIYLKEILKRPFVAGAVIWNLADFSSEGRTETMPHINCKGLLTSDRKPKDVYYFYKAHLVKEPFIKIASDYWKLRSGVADSVHQSISVQPLEVYANFDSVELLLNGLPLGRKKTEDKSCLWDVPFVNGNNKLEAVAIYKGRRYSDFLNIEFQLIPWKLNDQVTPFKKINVLLGSERFYLDPINHQIWLPDQPYRMGSWGHIGGKPFKMKNSTKESYGTDSDILGTDDDPVYQTQNIGIERYRLDVPDGEYAVTLHFSELQGGRKGEPFVYNLDSMADKEKSGERIFDVEINRSLVLEKFNIMQQFGIENKGAVTVTVSATGNNGIEILFRPHKGEPVLNALQVRKIY
jgi:beta-galactosidase